MKLQPCLHCKCRTGDRPRGLCSPCYASLLIRHRYASCYAAVVDKEEPQTPTEPRQEGEAAHRCLWCLRWRCWERLSRCLECLGEYEAAKVGMPGYDPVEDADLWEVA